MSARLKISSHKSFFVTVLKPVFLQTSVPIGILYLLFGFVGKVIRIIIKFILFELVLMVNVIALPQCVVGTDGKMLRP